ncbi:hypothetical protein KCP78_22655 [Salmonella enterica subsp. enterica]|nr:hypothetical protein KCP78_22655 [Salmonella enterica subsp. enterica]
MAPEDIREDYIASSRALAVTGTHLSHPNTRAAVLKSAGYAQNTGCGGRWISTTAPYCGIRRR